ncbi:ChbG/HpnK family deacetylase, partial [bacterium]|nr:ChbG/HpnK family deacetylase [bacterium]
DARGYFHPTTKALEAHGAAAGHILAEVEAQLARARGAGLNIVYMDEHMCFSWLPGVKEALAELRQREGLIEGTGQERLPAVEGDFPSVADAFIAQLDAVESGTVLFVAHPGHDTAEMRRMTHSGLGAGQVARERELDTQRFTAPKVLDYFRSEPVEAVRFTELGS